MGAMPVTIGQTWLSVILAAGGIPRLLMGSSPCAETSDGDGAHFRVLGNWSVRLKSCNPCVGKRCEASLALPTGSAVKMLNSSTALDWPRDSGRWFLPANSQSLQ